MSLNKFTNTQTGVSLNLEIGCQDLTCSNTITTQNLTVLGTANIPVINAPDIFCDNLEASVKVTTQDLDVLGSTVCTGDLTVQSPGLLASSNIECTGLNSVIQVFNSLYQNSTQPIILRQPYTYFSGSFPLSPDDATLFINGIIIIANGTTGNYIAPSSIDLDAYILNACNVPASNGMTFIFTVLNRNFTTVNLIAPIDGLYGTQPIPQPTATSGAISTQFVYYRVGGIWSCLNN